MRRDHNASAVLNYIARKHSPSREAVIANTKQLSIQFNPWCGVEPFSCSSWSLKATLDLATVDQQDQLIDPTTSSSSVENYSHKLDTMSIP